MITTKQKDQVFREIFPHAGGGTIDGAIVAKNIGISPREVMKVIDYLTQKGYIEYMGMAQYYFQFDTTLEGDDFFKKGGFEFEETIAEMELNKLMLELQSLEELIPKEKYNRLMQGLGVIISALALSKDS